jgi:hypothetical protein
MKMRAIIDLLEDTQAPKAKRMPREPRPEDLQAAVADGFDEKIWYHGTNRRFNAFRDPKGGGIDELGPGIYLTDERYVANAWAHKGGFIVSCVIRKGPLFDLSKLTFDQQTRRYGRGAVETLHAAHSEMMNDKFGPGSAYSEEEFLEFFRRRGRSLANLSLPYLGYVGGYDVYSQIPGQVVIFHPKDVRIIARAPGE